MTEKEIGASPQSIETGTVITASALIRQDENILLVYQQGAEIHIRPGRCPAGGWRTVSCWLMGLFERCARRQG